MSEEHKIFPAEIEAGLQDILFNPVSFASQLSIDSAPQGMRNKRLAAHCAKATNQNQVDLHYLKTVLVTAGTSNKNDDYFDRIIAWDARHTPEDKPFNYEHDQTDIIGHITDCYVVDDDYKVIAEDTNPSDLPDRFHIITASVLYKKWDDATLQKRMDRILAEIAEDKWFVSMECLFQNFDYLLVKANEKPIVKARNNDTAFLTKYLRAYGGKGEYEGYQVHRLLKNIVFSGKGLVRNPANPESIILPMEEVTANNQNTVNEVEIMADANIDSLTKQIAELTKKVVELTASNSLLSNELSEAKSKASESAKAAVDAELSTLKAEVKARDELNTDLKAKLAAAEEKFEAQVKAATESAEAANKLKAELEKVLAEKRTESKVSKLVAKGMKHEDAVAKAEVLKDLTDAQFDLYLEAIAMNSGNEGDDEDEENDKAAAGANADVLNNAKPNADVNPNPALPNERQKVVAGLSQFVKNKPWDRKPAKKTRN